MATVKLKPQSNDYYYRLADVKLWIFKMLFLSVAVFRIKARQRSLVRQTRSASLGFCSDK